MLLAAQFFQLVAFGLFLPAMVHFIDEIMQRGEAAKRANCIHNDDYTNHGIFQSRRRYYFRYQQCKNTNICILCSNRCRCTGDSAHRRSHSEKIERQRLKQYKISFFRQGFVKLKLKNPVSNTNGIKLTFKSRMF